jgi:predicted nucleotide-binding protein
MEEELRLFQTTSKREIDSKPLPAGNQIFIVHGHDEEMKQYVARTITQLGLDPIILHEKPNQGKTIIEKFSDYAEVAFAVVLLSPDDIARKRNDAPDIVKSRARQNVVLELGYFLGKLGRNRVVALYREEPNFEMPSDYSGVLFVPFDSAGRWQFDLGRELKAAGFNIDANKLI